MCIVCAGSDEERYGMYYLQTYFTKTATLCLLLCGSTGWLVIEAVTWYWSLLYTDKTFTIAAAWVSDTFIPRRTWVKPIQISKAHKDLQISRIVRCIWIKVTD